MKPSALSSPPPGAEAPEPTPAQLGSPDAALRAAAWERAWEVLWGACLGRLRRAWAGSLQGTLDLEGCTAAALQDISLEVMREPGLFQTFAHLKQSTVRRAWLKSVDHWRKLGKPGGAENAPLPMEAVSREAPPHLLMDLAMVLEFIRAWPPLRREVFLLTYLEGLGSLEVAQRVNLTPVNVRIMLMRGRDELCQEFPSLTTRSEAAPTAPVPRKHSARTIPSPSPDRRAPRIPKLCLEAVR